MMVERQLQGKNREDPFFFPLYHPSGLAGHVSVSCLFIPKAGARTETPSFDVLYLDIALPLLC